MRAFSIAVVFLLATELHVIAYEHFISPNKKLEAYTTPNTQDGTGMKLFLRRAGTRDTGFLVFENMRWIDAKWSPDSQFLAVVDHNDGHIADVYVFGVGAADAAQPQITLYYQSPDPGSYDVVDWRPKARSIVLTKEVRDQEKEAREHTKGFAITRSKVVARIGDAALPLPSFE
jgi:hypothetical protein